MCAEERDVVASSHATELIRAQRISVSYTTFDSIKLLCYRLLFSFHGK